MAERLIFGVSAPPQRTARYRLRHAAELAAGRHPMTGEALLEGHTCRECRHCVLRAQVAGRYWKCKKGPVSGGPATDLKVSWPACVLFVPREE